MADRSGLPALHKLTEAERRSIGAIVDTLQRMTGQTLDKLKPLSGRTNTALISTATLAQTIARVNELAADINGIRDALNALQNRIQED